MPKPPPRSSSGSSVPVALGELGVQAQRPAGRDLEALGVEDLRPDVGVDAGQVQRRLRRGRPAAPRPPAPPAIEKPNFWSSCAVAMYSWVCASTPVVTRTITRGRTPSSAARSPSRAISANESTMIRPTPAVSALAQLGDALVVAVQADPAQVDPGPLDHGQLAAGADVDAQPLLAHPAGDRGAEEGLRRVVDVPAGEGRRRRRGPARAGPPRPPRTPACRPGRRSRSR